MPHVSRWLKGAGNMTIKATTQYSMIPRNQALSHGAFLGAPWKMLGSQSCVHWKGSIISIVTVYQAVTRGLAGSEMVALVDSPSFH